MGTPFDPIAEYKARTTKSAAWFEEASKHLPGGVTGNVKFFSPYPVYAKRAKGAHLWDLDGNEYIDYMLCFGPLILGHGHPRVVQAIRDQIERDGTVIFGAPHELEARMIERLKRLFPFADAGRFTNSGLEATLHALRIARGAKRRHRIAKFEGHYHGSYDEVLVSLSPSEKGAGAAAAPRAVSQSISTSEETLKEVLVLPYNDIANTTKLLRAHRKELAAVIVEPVQRGFIPGDREFLKALRETTRELDLALVYDEGMSGFRMQGPGGAVTGSGIDPDLICLGKIIGGGFPIGAFLGRRELMDAVNPATRAKEDRVFHGGTFNGHPTILAAGMATLDLLEAPGTYARLSAISDRLRDGLNELFERTGTRAIAVGPYSTFNILFTERPPRNSRESLHADAKERQRFDFGLLARGIHLHPDKPWYTCTEHTDADLNRTLAAAEEVLRKSR